MEELTKALQIAKIDRRETNALLKVRLRNICVIVTNK